MDKIENEIVNCLQLDNLALKLEVMADNINIGDAYYTINCIEKYPFFDGNHALETRNVALEEYLELLVRVFIYSCRLINDSTDELLLESIDSSVVQVFNVITSRKVKVQLLPMAKELRDLYDSSHARLMKIGLNSYAVNLEKLRNSIFLGWMPIG